MDNLSARVNARIGTSRTRDFNRLVGNRTQRLFDEFLNARAAALPLPAVVGRAVILYAKCDANG